VVAQICYGNAGNNIPDLPKIYLDQTNVSMRLLLLLFTLVFYSHLATAQLSRNQIKRNNYRIATYTGNVKNKFGAHRQYFSLGISLNALNYFGDLAPVPKNFSTNPSLTKPAIGFSYALRIGPRQTIQASFAYGGIRGSDNLSADKNDNINGLYRYQRNLSFRNRIKELSVVMVIDYFKNNSVYLNRVSWTPYAFAGVAIFHHNPQAQVPATDLNGNRFSNAGEWVNLQPLGTEGQHAKLNKGDANYSIQPYKLIQPAIPFGVGARFRLNDQFDLSSEFSVRYLFTDYIDDVSRNYVDLGAFGNNELTKALSYRSNEIATPNQQYISNYDGRSYSVLQGYGMENKSNVRGNKNNNDLYTVFTVRVTYLMDKHHFKRPKYR
jgi:hypothetical protein